MRLSRVVVQLAAVVFLAAGCGGGGDQKGRCMFGPDVCSAASGGGGASSGYTRGGTGPAVFDLPANVSLLRVDGRFSGTGANFIVWSGPDLLVNEIIGTDYPSTTHSGVYVVEPGDQVRITGGAGVEWTVAGVDGGGPPSVIVFNRSGVGDAVFTLPDRASRYRLRAAYAGPGENFVVWVGSRLLVNAVIGQDQVPVDFDGTYQIEAGARVEILRSAGVQWSINELR